MMDSIKKQAWILELRKPVGGYGDEKTKGNLD